MHRERALRCELGASVAPWVAAGSPVPAVVAEHMATCLRCQADVARHRRARRQLRALAAEEVLPPPGALDAVLAALDTAPGDAAADATRWAAPSVVATAAGAAAGVGVWVWRRRQAV